MRRLTFAVLLLLAVGCEFSGHWERRPHYARFPVETVDSLRDQLNAGPATLRSFDSIGKPWLQVEPLEGAALRPMHFEPLDKAGLCPPSC